jgi:hypothetical protein
MEKLSSIGCHLEENRKPQTVFRDTALAAIPTTLSERADAFSEEAVVKILRDANADFVVAYNHTYTPLIMPAVSHAYKVVFLYNKPHFNPPRTTTKKSIRVVALSQQGPLTQEFEEEISKVFPTISGTLHSKKVLLAKSSEVEDGFSRRYLTGTNGAYITSFEIGIDPRVE